MVRSTRFVPSIVIVTLSENRRNGAGSAVLVAFDPVVVDVSVLVGLVELLEHPSDSAPNSSADVC